MAALFDDLVARYKQLNIPFPDLKAVTLAQWILESGYGKSQLAIEHLNFAGLKWRSEMVGYATPVQYQAHDGLDFYCKFATLDDFLLGFWRFIARPPYKGWEKQAAKGETAFIDFIGPIYNPSGKAYVKQVMALLPEARKRLDAVVAVTLPAIAPVVGAPKVIVIDPGHGGVAKTGGSSPNNAKSPSGELEKHWTLDFAKRTRASLLAQALQVGKNVKVLLTRETDINLGLSARANVAKANGATVFLSIHMNGFNGKARGIEALVSTANVNKAADEAFATVVYKQVVSVIQKIDPTLKDTRKYGRGVRDQSLGVLSDLALGNSTAAQPCVACLVELEFMDVPAVEDLFQLEPKKSSKARQTARNRQEVADALAKALLSQV